MEEEVTKEAGRQALIRANLQDVVWVGRTDLLNEHGALLIQLTGQEPVLGESIFTGVKAHLSLIDLLGTCIW